MTPQYNPRHWPHSCQGLRSLCTDFSRGCDQFLGWDQSLGWASQKAVPEDAERTHYPGDAAEAEGKENLGDLGAPNIKQTSRFDQGKQGNVCFLWCTQERGSSQKIPQLNSIPCTSQVLTTEGMKTQLLSQLLEETVGGAAHSPARGPQRQQDKRDHQQLGTGRSLQTHAVLITA